MRRFLHDFWRFWRGPLHASTGVVGLLSAAATIFLVVYLLVLAVSK